MSTEQKINGNIYISHRAISTIAYHAALESYGLVGLAPKNKAAGLANVLIKDPNLGVSIEFDGYGVGMDLYIVVEYGTSTVTYTHIRALETPEQLVCCTLLEKKKTRT